MISKGEGIVRLFIGIVLIGLASMIGGVAIGFELDKPEQQAREYAICNLEVARNSHQYYVDNPDKIWWAEDAEQDAEWVRRYNYIISLLENQAVPLDRK